MKNYKDGLIEAWDCARDILTMSQEEFDSIFDEMDRWEVIENHTPTACINAIKEYRDSRIKPTEIEVGDELIDCKDERYIVTRVSDKSIGYIHETGRVGVTSKDGVRKTGRHFPQIKALLSAIGGK